MLISERSITAFERGEKRPSVETLGRIADVLQFPIEFFSGPDLEELPLDGSSFRALTTLTASQRDQALGSGALAFALSDWIGSRFTLPTPNIPRLQGVDAETAAMAIRAEWGIGERSIKNVIHLLEAHGVRVFSVAEDCAAIDAFSCWRGDVPYIFLNTIKSAERIRMDAAHELGHLVMHWRGGPRSKDAEYEADQFGSAMLMPRASVIAEAPRGGTLEQLIRAKHKWNVSLTHLAYRMHKVGLLSDWQYRSLFMEIGKRGYRTHEPSGIRGESSQILAKVFGALREEGVTRLDIAEELHIHPDELNKITFALVLTALAGGSQTGTGSALPRPDLRVV